jgi:hypothetical protein
MNSQKLSTKKSKFLHWLYFTRRGAWLLCFFWALGATPLAYLMLEGFYILNPTHMKFSWWVWPIVFPFFIIAAAIVEQPHHRTK